MPLGVLELDARSSTYGKPIVTPNNAAMMNNRDISFVADWPDKDSNLTSIRTGHFSDQLLSITKLNQQSALPHRRTRQLRSPRLYHAFPAPHGRKLAAAYPAGASAFRREERRQ